MIESAQPVFYFDVFSPYAYLAAERIDDLLPDARWQPIAFGPLLRAIGREPWSFQRDVEHEKHREIIEMRAVGRGLPQVAWPDGWPLVGYSVGAVRALTYAFTSADPEAAKHLARECFRAAFVRGKMIGTPDELAVLSAEVGLNGHAIAAAITNRAIKDQLRYATDSAIAAGVVGIPTVAVGGELFWGDDRLEDAVDRYEGLGVGRDSA